MDSRRRSGNDRRKQTGINMRMLAGVGVRRSIRRQDDQGHIFLVDQYSPVHFVTIVGILFLSVTDALLTLYLLGHGAYEVNPLMAYMLDHGPYAFFMFKYGLTIFTTLGLLIFREVVVRKFNVTTHSFLYLAAGFYVAVVVWGLYLVYYVI